MGGEEIWLDVSGWGQHYQVSNRGGVRSRDREVVRTHTRPFILRGRILKTQAHRQGYRMITLSADGVSRSVKIHRLVAEAFIPNPENHPHVLHWDDDPTNNRVENLRWGTQSDNMFDRVRNGNHPAANKTSCKHGHDYTLENTYFIPGGGRSCRTCRREAVARYRRSEIEPPRRVEENPID